MKCDARMKRQILSRALLMALSGIVVSQSVAQTPVPGAHAGVPECSFQELREKLRSRLAAMSPQERRGTEAALRMMASESRVAFIAREVRVNPNGLETEAWVRRDPARGFRIESIRPAGEIFLDDRKNFYLFQPKKNRWIQKASAMKAMREHSEELSRRLGKNELRALWQGQDTIAGRTADIVQIAPTGGAAGPSRRIWIDRPTGLRLKQEIVGADNRLLNVSYFLSVDFTPAFRVDDFTPPVGAAIVVENKRTFRNLVEATRAGFTARVPSYLPGGFELRVIEGSQDGDEKRRVTQRYANGVTVLSLIQIADTPQPGEALGVTRGGFSKNPRGGGDRAFLWRDADFRYILISALSDDDVRRVAESVR